MEQPFGIDFSKENLATVFATCVSCFDYTLDSRAPSDGEMLRFSMVRLRLTRWGEAVNIYKELGREQDDIRPYMAKRIKGVLVAMIGLFGPCASTQESAEDHTSNNPTNVERPTQVLLSTLEAIASERSRGKSLLSPQPLGFSRWPTSLVSDATSFIDDLEDYFPAAQEQRELCVAELGRINREEDFRSLESVVAGTDPWMSELNYGLVHEYLEGVTNRGAVMGRPIGSFEISASENTRFLI
jgi:Prion-inhibition and propagation